MTQGLIKSLILGSALFLAGCASDPDPKTTVGASTSGTSSSASSGTSSASGIGSSAIDTNSLAYFTQNVGDRVYFATDSSTLNSEATITLQRQAQWLMANSASVVIEGHADERGTREYNLALGARRAAAVRSYLVSLGVPANRVRTVSYGKERPVEVCSNERCWAVNRRAVTVVAGNS